VKSELDPRQGHIYAGYPITRKMMDTDIRVKSDCPYGTPRPTKFPTFAEHKAARVCYSPPVIIVTSKASGSSGTKTIIEFLRAVIPVV
jgi:hypothetical protein